MSRKIMWIWLILCVWFTPLQADVALLRRSDIGRAIDRFFSLHVEHRKFSPLLARRCLRVYIEQFDPDKTYLLESEVTPYLQMSEKESEQVANRLQRGDYQDFFDLNQLFQKAILRAKQSRKTLSVSQDALTPASLLVKSPAKYSADESDLLIRQQLKFNRFIKYHLTKGNYDPIAKSARLKTLFDKKMQGAENAYLLQKNATEFMDTAKAEHLISLHILKAFAKSLDTHTSFFSPEEAHEVRLSLEKQFEGVGVILFEGLDGIAISELIKGGPAELSGKIQPNDLLVQIDGIEVETLSFQEVLDLLKTRDRKELRLTVKRTFTNGQETLSDVVLTKKPITLSSERVTTSFERVPEGIIGKITLHSFYEYGLDISSERDIKEAIRSFQREGHLAGLILDLRENAGGFLSQAVRVASLFLSNSVVAISKYGQGEVRYLRNMVGKSFYSGPLVVLTSKASASASEIVAQALQDFGVAVIVGDERTFGKGSIQYQTVTDEKSEYCFKVTVGKYYTASGKTAQIEGVKADILVPSHYAPYKIGERYFPYALSADRVQPVFADPLLDLDEASKRVFQAKYLPYLQRVVSFWKRMLPVLKENSAERLAKNQKFQDMLREHEELQSTAVHLPPNALGSIPPANANVDLQMEESVNIIKDMIELEKQGSQIESPLSLFKSRKSVKDKKVLHRS